MRIRRHDALCDVIYHALLQDNTGCRKEQRCAGSQLDRPGDVLHPDFVHGKPAYFDVTVHCPLQESLLGRSAVSAGVAAVKGEEDKDAHHDELVQAAGGVFVPLVVESLGLWSAASRHTLCDGRLMVKILITTIQVNLVPKHKFTRIVVIKIFTINLRSQPFLGRHLGFHMFFHHGLFRDSSFFYSLAVFD